MRAHWAVKAKHTKAYRTACGWRFRQSKPRKWKPTPCEISLEYRCCKGASGYVAKDLQNAISACKALVDGMVDADIVANDSNVHLTWGTVDLVTRKDDPRWQAKGDGVTVTVRRL